MRESYQRRPRQVYFRILCGVSSSLRLRKMKGAHLLTVFVVLIVQDVTGQDECRFDTPGNPNLPGVSYPENSEVDSVLEVFTATDAVISVSNQSTSEYIQFDFNDTTRKLSLILLKSLTESVDSGVTKFTYTLTATCLDSNTEIVFTIEITDVNNKSPLFSQEEYELKLSTPWPSAIPININMPITVTDADFAEENAIVTFTTDNENVYVTSTLDSSGSPFTYTVQLYLNSDMSQITEDTDLNITATNVGLPDTYTETAIIRVTVNKTNVLPPKFDQPWYEAPANIEWPPLPEQDIDIDFDVTDPEGGIIDNIRIEGRNGNLVKWAEPGYESRRLVFADDIEDQDPSILKNGVGIIELVASDEGGFESKSVVLLFFDIAAESTTTVEAVTCPDATTVESCTCVPCGESTPVPSTPSEATTIDSCPPCSTPAFPSTNCPEASSSTPVSQSSSSTTEESNPCTCPEPTVCPSPSTNPEGTSCAPCLSTTEITSPTCPDVCESTSTVADVTTPPETSCPETSTSTTDSNGESSSTVTSCDPCQCSVPTTSVTDPCPSTPEPCTTTCEPCSTTCQPCATSCPPSDPCPTTSQPCEDDDDCENDCGSNTGFIAGIIVTSVLFVASAAAAAYFWRLLRKARVMKNLSPAEKWIPPRTEPKNSFGTVTRPVSSVGLIDRTSLDMTRRPSLATPTNTSSSPDSGFTKAERESEIANGFGKPQAEDSLVNQARNPLVGSSPDIVPVPTPTIPQPDYRTKPDYKVKINDTVEIVPHEAPEYSDTDVNNKSGENSDSDGGEGIERL